jgi:PKD repeat protein
VLGCIFVLLLSVMAVPASGKTVTIDNTTAGGISGAITDAGSGGTVILNPGTYFIDVAITITYPITIRANATRGGGPADTIIDGIRYQNKLFHAPNSGCAITLDNLTFQHFSNPGFHGGVVYSYRSPVVITSSKFVNCTASYGGAIFVDTSGVTPSSITTSGFSGCSATTAGGAIYVMFDQMKITSSSFTDCSAPTGSAVHSENAGTTIHFSRFFNNTGTVVYNQNFRAPTGTLDATNNWWGNNTDPSGSVGGVGTVDANPWLKLGTTADAVLINSTQTARIRANLTFNSDGTNTAGSGYVPEGIPVAFALPGGTGNLLPPAGNITSGANTTVFTPAGGGTSQVDARVDNESRSVLITILNATFTGTPTSGIRPLTVSFTDVSGGSPAMWNWSFGDGSWFNTTDTVARSPTHIYTSTGSYFVNLSVTRDGVTDTLSKAGYITVSPPTPTTVPTTVTPTSVPVNGGDDPPTSAFTSTVTTGSANVGGKSSIISVTVTGTGIANLIITGTPLAGPGAGIPPAPGTVYEYVDLIPARFLTINSAMIVFGVPASWLEQHRIAAEDIVLYHYSGSGWQALPTTPGATANGIVIFTAATPSFSLYAVSTVPHADEGAGAPRTITTISELAASSPRNNQVNEPLVTRTPVVIATETVVASVSWESGAGVIPLPPAVTVAAGLMVLVGGGFMVRRWWVHRQNPSLFDYDD